MKIFLVIWIVYSHSFSGSTVKTNVEEFRTIREVEQCISLLPEDQKYKVYETIRLDVERIYEVESWVEKVRRQERKLKLIKWLPRR